MSQTEVTRVEMDRLIDRHCQAEERGDVHGAVEDLADDVEHELAGVYRGRTRVDARAFYENLFGTLWLRRIVSRRRAGLRRR